MKKHFYIVAPILALAASLLLAAEPSEVKPAADAPLTNPTATPIRPSTNPQIDKGELLGHIQYLSSPELHGREAGSPDQLKAAQYVADEFKRYGLEPFGDAKDGKTGYIQEFPITVFKNFGKNNSMRISVGDTHYIMEMQKQFRPIPAGYKPAKADAGVAFAGYGIIAPEYNNYDDFAGIDLAGKWALILRYEPPQFGKGNTTRHADIPSKVLNCATRKAAGVMIVTGPAGAPGQGRGAGGPPAPQEGGDTLGRPLTNIVGEFDIPVIQITRAAADRILASADKKIADLQAAINKDMSNHSCAIPTVTVAAVSDIDVERKLTDNVIARLEGSDEKLKNECVIVGAHCDHVGMGYFGSLAGKDGAGKMHPGADDNASGTSGMLEIAQYVASLKDNERPKRTVIFMAFSGEEKGLLGSAYYTEHPKMPLNTISTMINLDMIGRSSDGAVTVSGMGSSKMFKELVQKDAEGSKLIVHLGSAGDGPSDHASFFHKNIPVLFFYTGTHADYHRPTDTWDKINAPVAAETAQLAAKVLLDLASRPDRPVFTQAGHGCYMGVGADQEAAKKSAGFPVGEVTQGGPADAAGIKKGDVITALNDQKLANAMDLNMSLTEYSPGDEIELKVKRGEEMLSVKVKLGARKARGQ
ncbi:MAG TPA: M28 family peptidase [Planctomycetota bacterium]|nr:M28 family peptidase [Planctomycetota bacterium]